MFDKKTVFILGAGASWHYGYPTGEELVRKIIDRAREASHFFRDSMQTNPIRANRPTYIKRVPSEDISADQIRGEWEKAFRECEEFINKLEQVNPLVIDYFLGQNPKLQPIGKLIIAWVILECEATYLKIKSNQNRRELLSRSPRLEDRRNAEHLDIVRFNDDWYRFLIHKLLNNCTSSEKLHENKVHFVTFNYDISLEYALYNGLNAIELLDHKDVLKFLGGDRILHVYGKIRDYPSNEFRPVDYSLFSPRLVDMQKYGDAATKYAAYVTFLDEVYEASRKLKVIDPTDKVEDEKTLSIAKKRIAESRCVYVLGYGFDDNNSKRLNLFDNLRLTDQMASPKSILFTNYGDINRINKKASKMVFGNFNTLLLPNPPTVGAPEAKYYCEKSTRDVYDALALDFDSLEER